MRTALALITSVAIATLGVGLWSCLFRQLPDPASDAATLFKYGSIGGEGAALPSAIWKALPELCADRLPGGYASLGFIYEPGVDRPIGVTERTVGVPRAAFNCATCHVGTIRTSASAEPTIVLGMPAHRMDVQRYARFVRDCVDNDQFTADRVLPIVEKHTRLSAIDRLVYRYLLIPGTRREVAKVRARFAWFDSRPDFGPGRFDDINPNKPDMSHDDTIGTADLVPVWNESAHAGYARHWDGNATTLRESILNSALAAGAPAATLDVSRLATIEAYLMTLAPPAFPFPVDAALAEQGKQIFSARCGSCHAPGGSKVGQVTPAADVGTDRHRADSYTPEAAAQTNAQGRGYPWEFHGYHASNGYVNVLLDGVWARAPYLHNGSVPSLRDLLEAPDVRPAVFYRGYDVYDPERMGFVSAGPDAEQHGFRFDTTQPGNSHAGHVFGVDLSAQEKSALIEYLKTL